MLNALTFGLLITAISGFAQGQSLTLIFSEIAALLAIGAVFVRRQLRQEFPLLPVDLLRIPIFALSMGTSICSFAAQMLAMVSLPFFLQSALGRDEVATGLLLTPWPLAIVVMAPIAGRLVERVHAGLLGCIGLAVFARAVLAGAAARGSVEWGHHLAHGAVRRRLRPVPVAQQSHHHLRRAA